MYLSTATQSEIEELVRESEEKNIPLCLRDRQNKLLIVSYSLTRLQNHEIKVISPTGTKTKKAYRAETVLVPVTKNDKTLAQNNYCYEKIEYDVILDLYSFDETNRYKSVEQSWKNLFLNNQIQ